MKKILFRYFVELTGNPFSSSVLKKITSTQLSKPLIKPFSKAYRIKEDEMEYPIHTYKNLSAFFTRQLKVGLRPIDSSETSLTSPVDGIVNGVGKIQADQTFLIKNHCYSLNGILGKEELATTYRDGFYFVLYLSPSHYHRIHSPIRGKLITQYTLGGKSYPVNDMGLRLGNQPFATNYRTISEYATEFGKVAVIKVGALNVNSIHVHHHVGDSCEKGEELGYFSFGSTVILFVENNSTFIPAVNDKAAIQMGESIGHWTI